MSKEEFPMKSAMDKIRKKFNRLMRRKEQYLKAWIAETGIRPSDCMLVEQTVSTSRLDFSIPTKNIFIVPLDKVRYKKTIEEMLEQDKLDQKRKEILSKLTEEEREFLGVK